MQSYTNERSVAISIKAAKLTARLLAKSMQAFLQKSKSSSEKHGEQSIKSLTKSGAVLESVEIPGDSDIGSFKKTARKYNINFHVKKDDAANTGDGTSVPSWIVFFKAKDAKSMDMAFKEFSQSVLAEKAPKPSIAKEMERFKDIAKGQTPEVPAPTKGKADIEI